MCFVNVLQISAILHIGRGWEYQTYYSLEEDENIRYITHRKRMRISDILHIGRGWEYQTYYSLEEDENIRHITHWRRMRFLYLVFYLSNWLNQTVYYEASTYVFPAYHGCMNCYYDSSSSSCVNTFYWSFFDWWFMITILVS